MSEFRNFLFRYNGVLFGRLSAVNLADIQKPRECCNFDLIKAP